MRCDEVRRLLWFGEAEMTADAREHLAGCNDCAGAARSAAGLDALLGSTLVVDPPDDVKARLAQLVAAEPSRATFLRRLGTAASALIPASDAWTVQALVVCLLAAGAWQVWALWGLLAAWIAAAWLGIQLLLSSPALAYLEDLSSQVVPIAGWLVAAVLIWVVITPRESLLRRNGSQPPL